MINDPPLFSSEIKRMALRERCARRVIIDATIQISRMISGSKILMIIISHCWPGTSHRISVRARTRQIVYYRIRASWTFVYIIKPSSPSMYGVSLRSQTFLKLRANLPFYLVHSEPSLYGSLASTC